MSYLIQNDFVKMRLMTAKDIQNESKIMDSFGDWPNKKDEKLTPIEQTLNMLKHTLKAKLPLSPHTPLQIFVVVHEKAVGAEILGISIVETVGTRIKEISKAIRPRHRGAGWGSKISDLFEEWIFGPEMAATEMSYHTFEAEISLPQASRAEALSMKNAGQRVSSSGLLLTRWRLTRDEWLINKQGQGEPENPPKSTPS